tara:strand:+ start:355 stop:1263 length:909 start_codon:yes stop_codon:yes gene_type:complete
MVSARWTRVSQAAERVRNAPALIPRGTGKLAHRYVPKSGRTQSALFAKLASGNPRNIKTTGVSFVTRFNKVTNKHAEAKMRIENKVERVLNQFGAYVRTTAKNSMRLRKKKKINPKKVRRVSVSVAHRIKKRANPVYGNLTQQKRVMKGRPGLISPEGTIDLAFKEYPYSKPGEKPYAHEMPNIRKMMAFKANRFNLNVVIGPLPRANMIANLMEYGGTRIKEQAYQRNIFGQLVVSNLKGYKKSMPVKFKARPFMRPAFWKSFPFLERKIKSARLDEALANTILQKAGTQAAENFATLFTK